MKVLERPADEWQKRLSCNRCRALLEADKNDLWKKWWDGERNESGYWAFYVVCPICSNHLPVSEKELGYTLQQNAKSASSGAYDR